MNPYPTLGELSKKLGDIAESLGGVATDLGELARVETNNFEHQTRREIADLIATIEGTSN